METASQWTPELINLEEVDGAFSFEEGLSRPDWRVISNAIRRRAAEGIDLSAAWDEAVRQWLIQLQRDLGGEYQVAESRRFFLLASVEADTRKKDSVLCGRNAYTNSRASSGCSLEAGAWEACNRSLRGAG